MFVNINFYPVSIFHQRQQAAVERFGGDMSYHQTVRTAGTTTIGYQCNILAKPRSHDQAGWFEHFRHSGGALGSDKADHDNIARFYLPGPNSVYHIKLPIEYPGHAFEFLSFLSGDLGHRSFFGQVAIQDLEMPRFF